MVGLGDEVGTPGVARVGLRVLAYWADRATKDLPWTLRTASVDASGVAEPTATQFNPPPSLGGARFSPSLLPFGADRALLLWTEEGQRNGESAHEVRGVVVNSNAAIEGVPFAVSLPSQNAGQPHAALRADGNGIVGYLVVNGDHYEVAAAGIHCQ